MATVRRARAMSVLGATGLLVTGGGLMAASSPVGAPSASVTASPWLAATPQAEQKWAQRAQVTLASLETQISQVARTRATYNALPLARRPDPAPYPIRALDARGALLEQQKTTLSSELATWRSMQDISRRLADTDDHVSSLDRAIKAVPQHRRPSPAESSAAQQLSQQRTIRLRQRDSQRNELNGLRQSLHQAMTSPLSNDDDATKSITSMVDQLIEHPDSKRSKNPNPLGDQPRRPEVISPKDRDDQARQDVGNGAPPTPGRDRPKAPSRPEILAAGPDTPQTGADAAGRAGQGLGHAAGGTPGGAPRAAPPGGAPAAAGGTGQAAGGAGQAAGGAGQAPGGAGQAPGGATDGLGKDFGGSGGGSGGASLGGDGSHPESPGSSFGQSDQPFSGSFEKSSDSVPFIGPGGHAGSSDSPSTSFSGDSDSRSANPRSSRQRQVEEAGQIAGEAMSGDLGNTVSHAVEAGIQEKQARERGASGSRSESSPSRDRAAEQLYREYVGSDPSPSPKGSEDSDSDSAGSHDSGGD